MANQQGINAGAFIPTTSVWDVSQLYETDVSKPEFKELLVRLFQNMNNMAMSVNGKDAGIYHTDEFVNGQVFFPNPSLNSSTSTNPEQRQVYRKVINFGALPNNANKPMAHGIELQVLPSVTPNPGFTFTRIYGAASDPTNGLYIPLPYASSVAGKIIELYADVTNINVTTASNMTAYATCYIVLEYLKS
jgi:hypothetical protein